MKGDTKKPEYKALFPYGKIPGFKGNDGFSLIEGKAIARYGAFSSLSHLRLCFPSFSPRPSSSFTPSLARARATGDIAYPFPATPMMRLSFTVIPVRIIHVEDTSFSIMP